MASSKKEKRKNATSVDEKVTKATRESIDKWIFRLLLVLIGVTPLIVLGSIQQVISPKISTIGELTSGTKGDLFTQYKASFVLTITAITAVLLAVKIFVFYGKIRKTIVNYFLGAFVLAIVISTIASPNITIALDGQYNRADGAISWLCYIALAFIAMNIEYPKNAIRYVVYTMTPFVIINLYVITSNFYGKDVLQKPWMQSLVSSFLPEGAAIGAGSFLVGTLNQWNYMSGMFAIMTVMYLAYAIVETDWVRSIASAVVAVLSISVMFFSISTSGFLTVVVLSLALIALVVKTDNKVKSIIVCAVFILIAAPIFNTVSAKDPRIWAESFGFFENLYVSQTQPASEPVVNDEGVNNQTAEKQPIMEKTLQLPVLPARAMSAGSGRVYIWEKTIDQFKERPLVGYGLDSLMYNFPHYHIDARAGMYDENTITDKPHNTYLGVLYGTGIVGFIALVFTVVMLSVMSVMTLFQQKNSQFAIVAIASGAYFVQAMFNDSLPGISAITWVFIGMTFALMYQAKQLEGLGE